MSEYTPDQGNQVELALWPPYTPPLGNAVALPLSEITGPPLPPDDFISPLSVLTRVVWDQPARKQISPVFSHGPAFRKETGINAAFDDADRLNNSAQIPWARLNPNESSKTATWRDTEGKQASAAVRWRQLQPKEKSYAARFRHTRQFERDWSVEWRDVLRQDVINGIPWARQVVRDTLIEKSWPLGQMRFPDTHIVWGFGKQPETIVSNPLIEIPPFEETEPEKVYNPPPGNNVGLPLNCLRGSIQGNQVALPIRQFECLRRTVVVENDIILKRVDTDEEVPAYSLSIRGDIETATNTWAAELPMSALSIVEPTGDQPVECIATMNGVDHLLLLERWGDSRRWTNGGRSDTVTVQGSSISRELDAPYRSPGSRFEELTLSAFQLMQQEIPVGSGWTISRHSNWTDYEVPGGTWSYTDLTPLQAIVRIAAATGAVIQQIPDARELRVVPRYPVKPWDWDATPTDKQVDFGLISSASGEFRPVPKRNGIYVAGETNGVLVQAQRTGSAGDPWLDMVVDPLITAAQAGLQRATAELAATGARSLYSAQMPIKVSNDTPGLIRPGELVEVVEDESTSWTALAVDWSINGQWSDSDGLTVWTEIGLERYRDD